MYHAYSLSLRTWTENANAGTVRMSETIMSKYSDLRGAEPLSTAAVVTCSALASKSCQIWEILVSAIASGVM